MNAYQTLGIMVAFYVKHTISFSKEPFERQNITCSNESVSVCVPISSPKMPL